MKTLENIIHFAQHPFFMVIGGLLFYFTLKWSWMRNKEPDKKFWEDQKDEIVVSLIGGMLFVIWDDEVLEAIHHIFKFEGAHELQPYYYLLVAPIIERIYKLFGK